MQGVAFFKYARIGNIMVTEPIKKTFGNPIAISNTNVGMYLDSKNQYHSGMLKMQRTYTMNEVQ